MQRIEARHDGHGVADVSTGGGLMPRRGRGGQRQGAPQTSYSNRADLNAPKPMPPQAATGQPYGVAGQQLAAQQQIPVAPPPAPGGQTPPSSAPSAPPAGPLPGQVVPLNAPTMRPDEHFMTGAPMGPGAGPEVLSMNQGGGMLADRLDELARTSGNTDLQVLASRARQLGQ